MANIAGNNCPSGWHIELLKTLVSVIKVMTQILVFVPLPSFQIMEQVTRGCVVEQEISEG